MSQLPDGPVDSSQAPADVNEVTRQVLAELATVVSADAMTSVIANALVRFVDILLKRLPDVLEAIGKVGGETLVVAETAAIPLFAGLLEPILDKMFETHVGGGLFGGRDNDGARKDAARAVVDAFVAAIERDAPQPIEQDDEGSKRLATFGVHAAIEGWFNAFLAENLTEIVPFHWLNLKDVTEFPEEVVRALGISRLIRRAIGPLVNATATVPMTWAANVKYRPTKLSPATAIRQYMRGQWDYGQMYDSLTRDGYRDEHIDALVNEQQKFLSNDDLAWELWQMIISQDEAVATLKDQGWDEQTASKHLIVQGQKREDTIAREVASAATAAHIAGRLTDADLADVIDATIPSDRERDLLVAAARARRSLRKVSLSPAEAKACVLAAVIPLAEYRAALERDGYIPDAVDALEMLLRLELDAKQTAASAREQQAKDKAAAAKAKADAAAAKKAEVDAAAALKRQGPVPELVRAVVRGLIPIARLVQVLQAQYDADTVQIYVDDVETQRQAYVDQQQKAADAAKRAGVKGLSTGELQTALTDGILTEAAVRQQLAGSGLVPADVDVLVATMVQTAADHAAAVKVHDAAVASARAKQVSLSDAEQLVRAGHWTLAQYNALLATLGYVDAAVVALDELLQDAIAKDAKAAKVRADAAAANAAKGLSLSQFRLAVIAHAKTLDQFQTFLVVEGYTADAQTALVAELRDAVTAADAARARRAAAEVSASDGRAVSLSDLTKAARLGILTPAAYQTELVGRGFAPDAVALELDLLLAELATTRAAQQLKAAAGAPPTIGLTLAQVAQAVKAGETSIDEYRARASQLGYAPADVDTLANVLVDQVDVLALAARRHVTIDGELAARSLSIAEVEAAVKAGSETLDQYERWLTDNGYGQADAALLRALLEAKL